jgi:hypothetical protein
MSRVNLTLDPFGFIHNLDINHSTLIHTDPLRIYNALTTSEGLDS